MTVYAHMVNGIIVEPLIEPAYWPDGALDAGQEIPIAQRFPAAVVANFIDVTAITPQPGEGWTTTDGGKTFSAPIVTTPTPTELLIESAHNALAAGIEVVSAGTPALNGIYTVDQLSQMDIIAIETSINAGKGFPGGATTLNYPDASGSLHTFSETQFTDFAAAVRDFVYACKSVISGQSTVAPTSNVTIA